jgi:hypothetical protein
MIATASLAGLTPILSLIAVKASRTTFDQITAVGNSPMANRSRLPDARLGMTSRPF